MRVFLLTTAVLVVTGCSADAAPEDAPDLRLSAFEDVDGVRHLRAPLRAKGARSGIEEYVSRGASYGSLPVNILFYDIDGRVGRWLFEDNRRWIVRDHEIRDSATVRAFLYEMIETDTDGNGSLGTEDARTLALSDPTGRRVARIAAEVDQFRSLRRLDGDTVLLFYEVGGAVAGIEVNIESLEVEHVVRIPPVPAGAPAS